MAVKAKKLSWALIAGGCMGRHPPGNGIMVFVTLHCRSLFLSFAFTFYLVVAKKAKAEICGTKTKPWGQTELELGQEIILNLL